MPQALLKESLSCTGEPQATKVSPRLHWPAALPPDAGRDRQRRAQPMAYVPQALTPTMPSCTGAAQAPKGGTSHALPTALLPDTVRTLPLDAAAITSAPPAQILVVLMRSEGLSSLSGHMAGTTGPRPGPAMSDRIAATVRAVPDL